MDQIDEIVDRAIRSTALICEKRPDYASFAIKGLKRVRDTLALDRPDHLAGKRLSASIWAFERM